MDFFQAVGSCFKNYASFSGRASRSEFWFFTLFCTICKIIGNVLDKTVLQDYAYSYHIGDHVQQVGVLGIILAVVFFIPSIAVDIRRLHDVNKSAWWLIGIMVYAFFLGVIGAAIHNVIFIAVGLLIPLLLLFYWFCKKGTDGDNRFGSDPLAVKE